MTLILYGRHTSYNVQKVLWLLDELELTYQHKQYGGRFKGLHSEAFIALNPFSKIPVLIDNETPVRESNTILRYLAASYSSEYWWNTNPHARTTYESWMDWSIDVFEKAFVGVFWGFYRTPDSKRNWPVINENIDQCLHCLSLIEQQLKLTPFLAGQTISLADICIGVFMYRLNEIDLDIHIPTSTHKWYESLKTRPAYQKWVMSDFSELMGRENY